MANEITSAYLTELSNIAIDAAQGVLSNQVDLTQLVTQRVVLPGQYAARFPVWDAATAAAVTEGSSISNSAIGASGVLITPSTKGCWGTTLTDLAANAAEQAMYDLGQLAGNAVIKKRNEDIFTLFDSFTTNTVLASGAVITESVILQGMTKLRQHNALGDIYLVVTPAVVESIMKIYSANTNNTTDNLRTAIYQGQLPTLFGVKLFYINGPTESVSVKCGMFTKQAIGYAVLQDWDVRIRLQRDEMKMGYNIAVSSAYDVGIINETQGAEIWVGI